MVNGEVQAVLSVKTLIVTFTKSKNLLAGRQIEIFTIGPALNEIPGRGPLCDKASDGLHLNCEPSFALSQIHANLEAFEPD